MEVIQPSLNLVIDVVQIELGNARKELMGFGGLFQALEGVHIQGEFLQGFGLSCERIAERLDRMNEELSRIYPNADYQETKEKR